MNPAARPPVPPEVEPVIARFPMSHPRTPRWMSAVLALAGVYNLAWAVAAILFPAESFAYSGLQQPGKPLDYPQLWQGLGMVIGVFGLGYLLAATDPVRHWGVVLIGLVSKVLAGAEALAAVASGQRGPDALVPGLCNDLIWWVPFALILRHAYRTSQPKP